MYETDLSFKGKKFNIRIKTIFGIDDDEDHYDLEVSTNKRMSGDEFLALRKYLKEEGYIEQARQFNEEINNRR